MPGQVNVLVIGLDGATFDILCPLMDAGIMPALQQLMKTGCSGVLHSTIPPTTGPAWATFQTGTNPGKHGIVDFLYRQPGTYKPMLIDANMIQASTLWAILSEEKRRICVMNVPLTYPVRPVNGYMIAGLLTPNTEVEFTYPSELREQLLSRFPDYIITPSADILTLGLERFVGTLSHAARVRYEVAQWLIRQGPWDLFMIHFQETDILQHALWACLDQTHPRFARYSTAERESVYEFYRTIDRAIENLIQSTNSSVNIIISDHGFGPACKRIYLNRWLADHHYLKLTGGERWMEIQAHVEDWLRGMDVFHLRRRWLPKDFKRGRGRLVRRLTQDPWIDWPDTRAFLFSGTTYGNLYVNLMGRDPYGAVMESAYELICSELIEELQTLSDTDVEGSVVERVYRHEDVFSRPSPTMLPDLIVRPRGDYLLETRFKGKRVLEPLPKNITGAHREAGVFIATGGPFERHLELRHANIVDMAPVLLHLLGVKVPHWMDGHLWEEASLSLHAKPPVTAMSSPIISGEVASSYSTEDETQIIERLHRLGYL